VRKEKISGKKKNSPNKNVKGAHVVLYRLLRTDNNKRKDKYWVQAVLLCKRTQDAPIHPGYWALFGGELRNSELPEQAVLREVKEELKINKRTIKKMDPLCMVEIKRKEKISIEYFCSPLKVDMNKLRMRMKKGKIEGEGLGWFTAEEIHHLVMSPEDRIAVTKFFQENGI